MTAHARPRRPSRLFSKPSHPAKRLDRLATIPWLRPAALLAIAALAGNGLPDQHSPVRQMQMRTTGAERVDAQFDKCGEGGPYCVVDGDTIRIGDRRIRLVGFDTPEKSARCEAERLAASRATDALQAWLNRGPFMMSVNSGERDTDRYGRDLRTLVRGEGRSASGSASAYMVESGYARVYGGGRRAGWC